MGHELTARQIDRQTPTLLCKTAHIRRERRGEGLEMKNRLTHAHTFYCKTVQMAARGLRWYDNCSGVTSSAAPAAGLDSRIGPCTNTRQDKQRAQTPRPTR
eukprot:2166562-Rhodomonas_salina.1